MSEVAEKNVRVINFDGSKKNWSVWEQKFLARSRRKGYKDIIIGKKVAPDVNTTINESTAAGKELRMLENANILAYEDLILSIDGSTKSGKVAFNIVKMCKDKNYPEGNARDAWLKLSNKYVSKSSQTLVKLKNEFANCKLKKENEDPDEWITKLEEIQARLFEDFNSIISEEDLMIHIMNNLPKYYETTVEILEKRVGVAKDPLTLDELRNDLNLKFAKSNDEDSDAEDDAEKEQDHALVAGNFKGRCRACGKYGHKARDCYSKNSTNNNGNTNNNNGTTGQRNRRFNGKCRYCNIFGHKEADCFKKKRENQNNNNNNGGNNNDNNNSQDNDVAEVVLMAEEKYSKDIIRPDTWLGDTGASCHMRNNDDGMYETHLINEEITIGNGKSMRAIKVGKWRGTIVEKDGNKKNITLSKVKVVPELWTNLLSIGTAMNNDWKIGNQGKILTLQKNSVKMIFDRSFLINSCLIPAVDIVPRYDIASVGLTKGKVINANKMHEILGHVSEETMRKTAKFYDWKISGTLNKCSDCGLAKSKQANTSKEKVLRSKVPGERLFIDISSVKGKSYSGSKFWLLVVDDNSDMAWSWFLKQKSDLKDKLLPFVKQLKNKDKKTVKYIRCDNAGENKKFEEACANDGLGVQFEYTSPGTPQQNGRVERKFATLYGRVRAMLNGAKLTSVLRKGLWTECASTATKNECLMLEHGQEKPRHTRFYGKDAPYGRMLKNFGEMGVVFDHGKKTIRPKLDNRGRHCVFVGYPENHSENVYRMFNTLTKKVILTRDILWLNQSYGDFHNLKTKVTKLKQNAVAEIEYDMSNDGETMINNNNNDDDGGKDDPDEGPSSRVLEVDHIDPNLSQEIEDLSNWFDDPQVPDIETGREDNTVLRSGRDVAALMLDKNDLKDIATTTTDPYDEPTTFQEAWNHPDPEERKWWRAAIKKEFHDMNDRKVWRKIKRDRMPLQRRCVKCKWVFKKKRNGVYRARLVACGYSQIAGIDYSENYAPVLHDVTYRILLFTLIVWKLQAKITDVETAFLYGDLEEEIYMDCPDGMNATEDECLLLLQSIYGLVQAARQWWKKFVKILIHIGFEMSKADPCLLTRRNKNGIVFIGLYVDDCLCIGHDKAIEEVIKLLKENGLKLKTEDKLVDYLSCEVIFNNARDEAWLGQPHLLKNLKKTFGEDVQHLQKYKTPGTPGYGILRNVNEKQRLKPEGQKKYRTGVGMLLYLVKHSRPDIANSVRELSKVIDKPTMAGMKEMQRVIKYVLDTEDTGLSIKPMKEQKKWILHVYSDSDFAGDKEKRISIAGFVLYVLGVAVSWRSKGERSVTLSSTEAEYVAISEAVKEIKFVYQLLMSMKINVELPIVVRVDNIGAIYLSENATTSGRTKHVDTRYHYVHEYIEGKFIKIIFVRSEDNDSDIFTKNTSGELHAKHTSKMTSQRK